MKGKIGIMCYHHFYALFNYLFIFAGVLNVSEYSTRAFECRKDFLYIEDIFMSS